MFSFFSGLVIGVVVGAPIGAFLLYKFGFNYIKAQVEKKFGLKSRG